jgi:hypothetical protein
VVHREVQHATVVVHHEDRLGPALGVEHAPALEGAGASASPDAAGNSIRTVVPRPGALLISRRPPDCRTKPCTVARPSPVPLPALVVKNGSAARASTSGGMPGPSSSTASTT